MSLIFRWILSALMSYLWSEVECRLDMFVLCPRRPPRVVQLEALITEIGSAVGAALSGLQSLRRLTELAHHSHTTQTHCVSVPDGGVEGGQQSEGRRESNFLSLGICWQTNPDKKCCCRKQKKKETSRIIKKSSIKGCKNVKNKTARGFKKANDCDRVMIKWLQSF